jgi:translocation and assembly module TamB
MKRVLTKWVIASVMVVVFLIAVLTGTCFLIFTTEAGTQFAWQRAQAFVPDMIEVRALSGRLAGPLTVTGLKVKTEGFGLELDNFELEWQPSQLFHKILDVERIAVEGLRYTQLKTGVPEVEDESASFALPENIELPLEVRLGEVSLKDFQFRSAQDAAPFVIESARLAAAATTQKIDLLDVQVTSPSFSLEGGVSLVTALDYPLNGELHWQLPVPDYPVVSGVTTVSGSLREMTIEQTVAKPYDVQASVLLREPLTQLAFEALVEASPLKLQSLNPDLPPVTVQFAVTGKGVPEDITFSLDGWVEDPEMGRFDAVAGGRFSAQTVNLDELTITVPEQPARLTGRGQIELADTLGLNVTLDWQKLQWPLKGEPLMTSSSGTVQLTGTPEKLHASLDIAVGGDGNITGRVDRDNQLVDLALNWRNLQWPLKQPEVQSPQGSVLLSGTIDDYIIDMEAAVVVPEQTDATLAFKGKGSQQALQLSQITVSALEGKIEGTAALKWQPELKGSVDITGSGLNPGVLLKDWPGNLAIAVRAEGGMQETQPVLQLHQLHAQGKLRGYDLALDGEGSYDKKLAVLKKLVLSSGSTRLEADGSFGEELAVKWQVRSADLGTLLPDASGRIDGKGTLKGTVQNPLLTTTLNAEQLVYPGYRLRSLFLDADLDLTGAKQSRIALNLEGGNAAGVELRTMSINGKGNPDAHTITLDADTSSGQAEIALEGKLRNFRKPEMVWNFRLGQLKLKYPDLDGWALQAPSTGRIAAGRAELSQSCLQSGDALLCLQGKQATDGVQAEFALKDLPFSYLAPYLPLDIDVQGSLDGNGTFSQSAGEEPDADITINTSMIRLVEENTDEEDGTERLIVAFQPGDIQLQMKQGGVQARMELPLSDTDGIAFQAAVRPGRKSLLERPLEGQMTAEVGNLDFIADLIPDVQDLAGRLNGNMVLSGSLGAPVLSGRLALTDGAAKLEGPGLLLKDIEVNLSGDGDGGLSLTAHAFSENGELNIAGTGDLRGKETAADITVKGENFRLINTLEAQVDASPDLTIGLHGNRVDVGGKVVIPKALIKLKSLPESAVTISEDQVIVKSEEQETAGKETARETYARVRIILGDDVSFDGFGLKARIKGNILAIDKPGESTTGSGELQILDGEYRAYGQGLVIEKGRILFAGGPINQPGLDVQAVRRPAENITVGVQVRGNLNKPDFTLYSTPTMTQGNQLSYLVLGRAMSGSSTSEGSALSRAALALGLKGGSSVAAKIGGKLGLDQFGVASTEAGSASDPKNASFVIGKYLSPDVYVSYGLGLFDPVSTVRLQYAISSRWELVTESSGTASGGDIFYTIETGK